MVGKGILVIVAAGVDIVHPVATMNQKKTTRLINNGFTFGRRKF
jgi:hypothetical protein